MNAYAALLAGTGGPMSTSAGLDVGILNEASVASGAVGDEPDFFAVFQGTLEESAMVSEASLEFEESETAIGLDDDEAVALEEEEVTLVKRSTPEWRTGETGDLIPLLEIDLLSSEIEPPLEGTGNGGELGDEILPVPTSDGGTAVDPARLAASVGTGQEARVTFGSPTLSLAATVGDASPLTAGSRPTAAAPDTALLSATGGESGGIVEATPAILPDPDLSLVDPELRTRLGRVIDRMRVEHGHNVKVVEGFRTPERQNALFAQGRTAPGNVVTWTQNSMHSEGLAVDVVVDGSYAPHEGYRRLAQIAKEEGLQSLGPSDPGHLQLTKSGQETPVQGERIARIAQVDATAVPATQAQVAEPARVALQASIAEPAAVAQPAQIGRPAEVALPGSDGVPIVSEPPALSGDRVALQSTAGETPDQALPSLAASNTGTTTDEDPSFGEHERTLAFARAALRRERSREGSPRANRSQPAAEFDPRLNASALAETAQAAPATASVKTPSIVSAEALHRVTQVRELQELAYPKKLGQVTLRMLDGMSEEARMRVSLIGDGVATSIGVRDLAQADRMRSRIGILEQALRQRGLEPASTRVAALAAATTADAAVLTAHAVNATRLTTEAETFLNWTGPDTPSQDEPDAPPEQREPRQQPQDQRQENQQ